jgi:hypothetical protein
MFCTGLIIIGNTTGDVLLFVGYWILFVALLGLKAWAIYKSQGDDAVVASSVASLVEELYGIHKTSKEEWFRNG